MIYKTLHRKHQIIVCLILVLCGVIVARSNVFYVVFCRSLFVLYQYFVVFVLPNLLFSVQCFICGVRVLNLLFSAQSFICGVRVAQSIVFCIVFYLWGSCCPIYCLLYSVLQIIVCFLLGYVLLNLQVFVQFFVDCSLSFCDLFVLLRFMASGYPFGILRLFWLKQKINVK